MAGRPFVQRVFLVSGIAAMLSFSLFTQILPPTAYAADTVSGTVFRDFNANGTKESNETQGVAGVTVIAYDAANVAQGTTTTAADGTYTLNATGSGPYRVEFSNWPSYLQPGAHGTQSGTAVQFVAGSATAVDLALNYPAEYCQNNPQLCTTIQTSGANTGERALTTFPFDNSGDATSATDASNIADATNTQIGSVWGLAYNRTVKQVFSAAFVKRHVGLGPQGIGGIYVTTNPGSGTSTTTSLIDLASAGVNLGSFNASNASRDITVGNAPSRDLEAVSAVGKVGLGGLTQSEDGKTLYVVNLYLKQIVSINISSYLANGTLPSASNVASLPSYPATACVNGTDRPFGVKLYRQVLYLGVVCDASAGGTAANLNGRVYAYNFATTTWSTAVAPFALDYPRNASYGVSGDFSPGGTVLSGNFNPWVDTMAGWQTHGNLQSHPQPWLTDIEFDIDGAMVLGFADRAGNQAGADNYSDVLSDNNTYYNIVAGEVLRAANNNGTFALENGGKIGANGCGASPGTLGPGGGEYYCGEIHPGGAHYETAEGGLSVVPGTNQIVAGAMDPNNISFNGGVVWMDNTTGSKVQGRILNDGGLSGSFAKANGLGDLELLCNSAPIELGNRVWRDSNGNGIQDANEPGIAGVTVQLTDSAGTPIASVTTDSDGSYYFSGAPGTDTANATFNLALAPNTAYRVQIDTTQAAVSGSLLTVANADAASANADSRDSDATLVGSTAVINVTTENAGANNHTLDFGFTQYSLGNRVWADTNNNGALNSGETGIDGVAINLFADTNADGIPDSATPLQSTTTSGGGYYRFDGLNAGTYVVRIDPINFSTGALVGYSSSGTTSATPNNNIDNDDNGINNAAPATNGILSGPVTLGPGATEPANEADLGPGGQGTADTSANLTVDLGFYKLAVGNQLWLDTNNNGVLDSGESGTTLAGVRVELYDGATLVAVTTTDATGAYLFDRQTDSNGTQTGLGLAPSANYKVVIPASEFALGKPLANLSSSTGATAGTDNRDAGVDNAAPATNGISSATFALTPGATTGGATVTSATGTTSNPTLDFGFYTLSLGNRVFNDKDNNGVFDGTDEGFANVVVKLYRDSNNDGTPDGAAIATQTTTLDGYYLFTGLAADTYIVEVTPPAGYRSSTGTNASASGPYEPAPDADTNATDSDDNGTTSGGVIRSAPVTLAAATEPTGEPATPGLADTAGDANSNLTVDFALFQPMSLGNLVWDDINNNGVLDTGETGIINVAVTLYRDDGTPNGVAIATTTTAANGSYLFDNLVPGTYFVSIAPPTGYKSSTGTNGNASGPYEPALDPDNDLDNDDNGSINGAIVRSLPITLVLGNEPVTDGDTNANSNLTVDFGLFRPASLGDFVWSDTNKNGRQDAGEPGVQGVTATLYNAADDSVVGTQITDVNGAYLFDNLAPGSYYVVFSNLPTNYGFVLRDQGANDALDSDADQISGKTGTYTLTAGQQNLTVDAGIAIANTLSIGNLVWADYNNNGVVDAGEPGVSGVTVELLNAAGTTVLSSVPTDANGNYLFGNLLPGDYRVRIPASAFATGGPLENWHSSSGGGTYEPAPDPDNDTDNDDNGSTTSGAVVSLPITLTLGGEPDTAIDGDGTNGNLTVDLGLVPDRASLGDTVWYDTNRNNVQDTGEAGVPNVTVNLYKADGTLLETQLTDTNGQYLFTNLVPGDYYVVFDLSTLTPDYRFVAQQIGNDPATDSNADVLTGRTPTITLTAGENDTTWDAGVYQLASLGDFVWLDTNGDGTQDSGEAGVPNVTVHLLGALGSVLDTTTTDANGRYQFVDLEPGDYAVQFVAPAGYALTTLNSANANAATDSDADPSTGNTVVTTLVSGENDLTWDAGLVGAMSIGNRVWDDTDNNGVFDAGEAGIANVAIALYRDSNNDGTPDGGAIATTTTDANGIYVFANLLPGTYIVEITPPAGYKSSTGTNGSASGPYEPAPNPDNDVDSDDNGNTASTVIRSAPVTLVAGNEPVTDGDIDTNSNLTVDFGLFQPASLGSVVWIDTNKDGIKQADEVGVPNVTVTLYDAVDAVVRVETTNQSGTFLFSDLVPGAYTVGFTGLPSGATFTIANQGSDVSDSDADPLSGRTSTIILHAGENNLTVYAGLVIPQPTAVTLTRFQATWENGVLVVRWTTSSEIDTWGFHVLRGTNGSASDANRVTPSIVLARGRGQGGASYTWIDKNAQRGQAYTYWLEEIETNGATHVYGPAANNSDLAATKHRVFIPTLWR